METLPYNALIQIALDLPLEQVYDLCHSSIYLNETLCENEVFWQEKYLREFGQPKIIPKLWRNSYLEKASGGHIWAFGNNGNGQLGLGDRVYRDVPTRIPSLTDVKAISTSLNHSLVLTGKPIFTLFSQIKRMIEEKLILKYEWRQDLDNETNNVFEFTDLDGDNYLAEVQYENGQILPPI